MAKIGHLDSVEDGVIRGWAVDEDTASPAMVDVVIDGALEAQVKCNELRPDLVEAKRGTGWHGFSYVLPAKYIQSRASVTVSFSNGGPVLQDGRRSLPDFTARFLTSSALVSAVLAKGLWCVDRLAVSASEVMIEGWCVPPRGVPVPSALTHNGHAFDDLSRIPRNDIAAMTGMARDEIGFGFRARAALSAATMRHYFTFEHACTRRPFDPNQTVHYISTDKALPPEDLRIRVHGSEDVMSFVKEGSTAYLQLWRYLKEYFSASPEDFSRILDWGCGSGRMLRYFSDEALSKITGIDIDPEAIEWCRRAFPSAEFIAIGTEPPTPLESESFDLIYANSVLTHLRESDHIRWMQELHRLAKPNAVLLLTTSGERSWWGRGFPSALFTEWRVARAGFFEGGRNSNLDAIGVGDYYRNVFIAPEYIASNWSRAFEIIAFIPGGIGNLQDLTILRRRD